MNLLISSSAQSQSRSPICGSNGKEENSLESVPYGFVRLSGYYLVLRRSDGPDMVQESLLRTEELSNIRKPDYELAV